MARKATGDYYSAPELEYIVGPEGQEFACMPGMKHEQRKEVARLLNCARDYEAQMWRGGKR
jgi:hypothetical protein